MLEDLLKNKKYKHERQLRYLASKHEGGMLKIRFVLTPFSFVFLLSGDREFHVILETLDTEEATYIWHFPKDISLLPAKLKAIEEDLNLIREKGRQGFLERAPDHFSRVLHDYSDEVKGFVVWRDVLEERLW